MNNLGECPEFGPELGRLWRNEREGKRVKSYENKGKPRNIIISWFSLFSER